MGLPFHNPKGDRPWSWWEAASDLVLAVALVVLGYFVFKYGGTSYLSGEGGFPPPPESESRREGVLP